MENSTTYSLTKTTLKNGKFYYVVTDNNGNIISERKSNREYVACTIDGWMYFSQLDLIGKGDHARRINYYLNGTKETFENVKRQLDGIMDVTPAIFIEMIQDAENKLKGIETIAYLKN